MKDFLKSLNTAITGFMLVMRTQRNMRYHFLAALFVVILSLLLDVSRIELMIITLTVTFVLVVEMMNTAIEYVIDIMKSKYHPMAKVVKDIAAGAVLASAINAIVVGYLVFSTKIPFNFEHSVIRLQHSSKDITFICLGLVIALVILIKVLSHKGTPLRGGMPSGHAAISFAMWTIIVLLTKNLLVALLVFFMAFLVSSSRIYKRIHTFWEVIAGALLGIIVTLFIFQLFFIVK